MATSKAERTIVDPVKSDRKSLGTSSHAATVEALPTFPREPLPNASAEQTSIAHPKDLRPQANHLFDYRVSIPWLGSRFYLRIMFGNERRNETRLKEEGQISFSKSSIAFVIALWMICSLALFGSVIVLYLIKSALGINLLQEPSIFHPIFFN